MLSAALPNEYGQNWAASTVDQGTPGRENSVAAANTAPLILDVTHFPIIPKSTDPVTVTARIVDELATGVTATLFHRVDGAADFTVYLQGHAGDDLRTDRVTREAPDWVQSAPHFFSEASDHAERLHHPRPARH